VVALCLRWTGIVVQGLSFAGIHPLLVILDGKGLLLITLTEIDHSQDSFFFGRVGWASSYFLCSTTWANQGFIANCRAGSKCFPSQVYQLISNFVVTKYDEATFLAAKGMLQHETGFTTITASWKVWWCDVISHKEGIAELLG
jgi:hypothetical protein